jgi:predicted DCC family thiol-disulfide oxidoreductase YuxK
VQQVLRRLPPFRSIAWLYHVPGMRRVAQRLYGWIARRRYKLSGSCESGACKVSK